MTYKVKLSFIEGTNIEVPSIFLKTPISVSAMNEKCKIELK